MVIVDVMNVFLTGMKKQENYMTRHHIARGDRL